MQDSALIAMCDGKANGMNTPRLDNPVFESYRNMSENILSGRRPVALYGFGRIGRRVFQSLRNGGARIEAIFDNNPALHGQAHQGIPLFSPGELAGTDLCVIVCSDLFLLEMVENLEALGYRDYIPYPFVASGDIASEGEAYSALMDMRYMHGLLEARKKGVGDTLVLRSVDVVITERCSFRCRDCANLMQYFEKPVHSDFDQTVGALGRLLDAADFVHEVHVLGGEPFLDVRLPAFLDAMEALGDRFDFILVYTNATIIPDKAAVTALRRDNIVVSITDYGNPRQKTAELTALFRGDGIHYRLTNATIWQDCGRIFRRNRTPAQNAEVLRQCCARNLPSLKDGRLFRCPFAGNAAALGVLYEEESEFVELSDASITRKELRSGIRSLLSRTHLKVCDYCGGRGVDQANVPAAVQADRPLAYERYSRAGSGDR